MVLAATQVYKSLRMTAIQPMTKAHITTLRVARSDSDLLSDYEMVRVQEPGRRMRTDLFFRPELDQGRAWEQMLRSGYARRLKMERDRDRVPNSVLVRELKNMLEPDQV